MWLHFSRLLMPLRKMPFFAKAFVKCEEYKPRMLALTTSRVFQSEAAVAQGLESQAAHLFPTSLPGIALEEQLEWVDQHKQQQHLEMCSDVPAYDDLHSPTLSPLLHHTTTFGGAIFDGR